MDYTPRSIGLLRGADCTKSNFVQAIEAGNFAGFGESGVMENSVAKVVQGAAERQDRLVEVGDRGTGKSGSGHNIAEYAGKY